RRVHQTSATVPSESLHRARRATSRLSYAESLHAGQRTRLVDGQSAQSRGDATAIDWDADTDGTRSVLLSRCPRITRPRRARAMARSRPARGRLSRLVQFLIPKS